MASTREQDMQRFLGTWQLVSVERIDAATGRPLDESAVNSGYISYTPDMRVMVIISRRMPGSPEEITAYAARWRLDGDMVLHEIDVTNRALWRGTIQQRYFDFHDDKLVLAPPTSPDFTHGMTTYRRLTWQRVERPD